MSLAEDRYHFTSVLRLFGLEVLLSKRNLQLLGTPALPAEVRGRASALLTWAKARTWRPPGAWPRRGSSGPTCSLVEVTHVEKA